jgi:outer membrane lipopolysaccharide assembly protein LptE/RlpB
VNEQRLPKNIGVLFTTLWVLSILTACGYRFTGSGNFPAGVKSVFIAILENRTTETGLENIVTKDLIYEFTRNRRAASKEKAEAVLSGVLNALNTETISHKGQHTSLERRVSVSVDLKLTDADGREIWSGKGISANEAYDVATDKLETEQNRREAISALSKRLSEKIYNRLTVDF